MVGWNTKKLNTKLLFKPFGSDLNLNLSWNPSEWLWNSREPWKHSATELYNTLQELLITDEAILAKNVTGSHMLCNNNKNYYVSVIVLFFYKFLITFLTVLFCNQSLLNTWWWNYMYFEFIGCILQISDFNFSDCHRISYI